MHPFRLASSFLLTIPLALVALGPGCGSNSNSGNGNGPPASDDGSTDSPIVFGDSPSGDVNTVPVDAGDPFCKAEAAFDQRCSHTAACDQTNLANCGQLSAALSDAARQSLVTCLATDACSPDDGGKAANDACFNQHMAAATPTAAQSSVRDKYCAVCGGDAGPTSCKAAFFAFVNDGGSSPIGDIVGLANDAIAAEIEQTCTGALLADAGGFCELDFVYCAVSVFGKYAPNDPCKNPPADAGAD